MVRRLGQGGMAEVFEAELVGAQGFARRVAIKRISSQIAADPSAAARFLEEARIASSLHHAGIVGVIDFGIMDGAPFQVLELVDGLNADQLVDRVSDRFGDRGSPRGDAGLPTDVALIIAADLAHALHHAHEASDSDGHPLLIVHRDVKPSNVLISWSGDIKLTDFGIAFARGRAIQTESGLTPGSWAFMAPEQRSRGVVDRRVDVFALGCTLYALLTGHSPQRDLEAAIALATGVPLPLEPPPGLTLDDDVRAILERALRPAPQQRYPSAAAMAGELGAALARRLARDPRSRMQELLTSVRPAPQQRAGLLDQLLAVELVLASEHGSVRQFELRDASHAADAATQLVPQRRTEPAAAPAALAPAALAPTPASTALALGPGLASEPAPARPMARVDAEAISTSASQRAPAVAAFGFIKRRLAFAAGVAAALALLWGRPQLPAADQRLAAAPPAAPDADPEASTAAAPPAPAATPTPPVRSPDTAPPAPSPTPEPTAQPSPAPAPDDSARPSRRDRERSPARSGRSGAALPSPAPAAPSPTPAPAAPAPNPAGSAFATPAAPESSTGYLKVVPRHRDPRMVNARVYIDGKLRGYSPDPITTTVGKHQVRVVLEDDTTELGTYTLEVKADHRDRGHPATLLIP